MGKEALDPRKLKHGDEAPVPLAERPELLLKPREKIRLRNVRCGVFNGAPLIFGGRISTA